LLCSSRLQDELYETVPGVSSVVKSSVSFWLTYGKNSQYIRNRPIIFHGSLYTTLGTYTRKVNIANNFKADSLVKVTELFKICKTSR